MASVGSEANRPNAPKTIRETGKSRSSRIPLDYHRVRDPISRAKVGLAGVALVVSVLAVAFGLQPGGLRTPEGDSYLNPMARQAASHGPVAHVHAAWEQDCQACHVPHQPIHDRHWWLQGAETAAVAGYLEAANQRCEACHLGPAHHSAMKVGQVQSCASCHHDHQGRTHDLTKVADATCTNCHKNVREWLIPEQAEAVAAGRPAGWDAVTHFPAAHPEFTLPTKQPAAIGSDYQAEDAADPGHLKFNHPWHMAAGIGQQGSASNPAWFKTYGDLPATDRERYFQQALQDGPPAVRERLTQLAAAGGDAWLKEPVQLTCRSCHEQQADDGRWASATLGTGAASGKPTRGDGRGFLPVAFERHCQACHPLGLPLPATIGLPDAAAPIAAQTLDIPHGLQPGAVHDLLTAQLSSIYLSKNPALLAKPVPRPVALPGQAAAGDNDLTAAGAEIQATAGLLAGLAFTGRQACTLCHEYQDTRGEALDGASVVTWLKQDAAARAAVRVKPANIPTVWYEHALFDHKAHRAMDCRSCHASADLPDGSAEAATPSPAAPAVYHPVPVDKLRGTGARYGAEEIMIPGKENCAACHAPAAGGPKGTQIGGVAHDCITCHLYHDADHQRAGIGPKSFAPAVPIRSGSDWLSGVRQ